MVGVLAFEVSRSLTTDVATYRYVHTDALGSPIAKTSSTGAVLETSEYEPFGLLLNRPNDDRAGYTGHVMDSASGLTYMQQRYMDPQLGLFLSVDPVTAYSNPVGAFNRYWYASGNPYRFIDPDGRFGCEVCNALLRRAAGAAVSYVKGKAIEAVSSGIEAGRNLISNEIRDAKAFIARNSGTFSAGGSFMLGAPIRGNSVTTPGITVVGGQDYQITTRGQLAIQWSLGAADSIGGGAVAGANFTGGVNSGTLQSGISTSNFSFLQFSATPESGVPVSVGGSYQSSADGQSASWGIKPEVGTFMGAGTGKMLTFTIATPPLWSKDKDEE